MQCCGTIAPPSVTNSLQDCCNACGFSCFGSFRPIPPPPFETFILSWSDNGPGGGTPTPDGWLNSFGSNSAVGLDPIDVPGAIIVTDDGTIDRLMISHSNPGVSGARYSFTLYKNGSATALTADILANQTFVQNLMNQIPVVRGDLLQMQVINHGSTNANLRQNVVVRFRKPL